MSDRLSLRLSDRLADRLEGERALRGLSTSALVRLFIEEGLRMQETPGIVFVDTPSGRQAAIAGTGLTVWQVMLADRECDGETGRVLRRFPHLTERELRQARAYAARYGDEIERAVARYRQLSEAEARRQYQHLFAAGGASG